MSWRDDRFTSILLKCAWLFCSAFLIIGGLVTLAIDLIAKGGYTSEGGIIAFTFIGVGVLSLVLYLALIR